MCDLATSEKHCELLISTLHNKLFKLNLALNHMKQAIQYAQCCFTNTNKNLLKIFVISIYRTKNHLYKHYNFRKSIV